MATTVTPEQVAIELGRTAPELNSTEYQQWAGWIAQAYQLIVWRYGQAAVDAMEPTLVDYVVLQAVAQHVRSWTPNNVRRTDVSVDDGRVSTDYHSSVGTLAIPDGLWGMLDPASDAKVFSTRLEGEPDAGDDGRVWTSTTSYLP